MARYRLGHHQGDLDSRGVDGRIGDRDENRLHGHGCPPPPTAASRAGAAGLTLTPRFLTSHRANTPCGAKSSGRPGSPAAAELLDLRDAPRSTWTKWARQPAWCDPPQGDERRC